MCLKEEVNELETEQKSDICIEACMSFQRAVNL
jgi:hypothetical protein